MKYTVDTGAKTIELEGTFMAHEVVELSEKYHGYTFRTREVYAWSQWPVTPGASPGIADPLQPLYTVPCTPVTVPNIMCDSGTVAHTDGTNISHVDGSNMPPGSFFSLTAPQA